MQNTPLIPYIKKVLSNMPSSWLALTTHRLDIYNEDRAKVQFLEELEDLYETNIATENDLDSLHTAYDYIRLGHPLSCLLEWSLAKQINTNPENVISFDANTMPILAILRTNLLASKKTRIVYTQAMPSNFNAEVINQVYGYDFTLQKIEDVNELTPFNGSTVLIAEQDIVGDIKLLPNVDFYINLYDTLGSVLIIDENHSDYIADIQHVRRRETVAMTPINCFTALQSFVNKQLISPKTVINLKEKETVLNSIKEITGTIVTPLVASSGLSMQYAIMMGLVQDAIDKYPNKAIKIVVPPNCYGGTNDQARRVAASNKNVEIVDLPVDGDNDMVNSIEAVLNTIAAQDAIPYIIAEIPTNPRVEVPDLQALQEALLKERKTPSGSLAISPVFILDQTFCPNVHFVGEKAILGGVKTISYASGSKFPSGGKCTAGYCVGNLKTAGILEKIAINLKLCDNEATPLQYKILASQLLTMNKRIVDAYNNTREFVTFIEEVLPAAKINFVSPELANQGFTPSVFSLDLPTKGNTEDEKEAYKRALNLKLINLMITKIPEESKFCVSYGQLKGCYWTIPATSTQGTTKEGDKDYIVRASLSPDINLALHKKVFLEFVESL